MKHLQSSPVDIQHVKELKRQTSLIAETSPVPTEIDELTVDVSDEDGKFVIKASLCCKNRSVSKVVMEKANGNESAASGSVKRQRTNMNIIELEMMG
ncbi:hypothetical protein U1Q18_042416 [Sarracenia purpurea var. burkii]